jgi:hypothetical protein
VIRAATLGARELEGDVTFEAGPRDRDLPAVPRHPQIPPDV